MTARALIVDDERAECELFADAIRSAGFEAHWQQDPAKALDVLASRPFDVVVTDLNMPGMSGIELCRRLKDAIPRLPVIVVTAFGSIDTAVEAMRAGAYDFITKPFDVDTVGLVLRRAVEHHALKSEVDALRRVTDTSQRFGSLIGTSEPMRRVYELIECLSESMATVLLTGESGTGKELVARELHRRGPRSSGPFIAVNCAAVPEALLESELFGHEKGAFTDARSKREGLFSRANGGTLFLDEIGDMPAALQAKLLRALEGQLIRPVGSSDEVKFDARIVTATNRDLELAVEQGRFREDLYYRINVVTIELPPLRARGGDVLLLAQSFLADIAVRSGKRIPAFTSEAAERIMNYAWPGNVRELRNCIERAVTLTRGEAVEVDALAPRVRDYKPGYVLVAGDDPSEFATLEEVERRYIMRVVDACQRNKSRAARVLGIGRKTLYRKLESFGVPVSEDDDE